ncbi:MAG: hypothetical protein FJX78_06020 [Armatimonadetes bacterium]|nr:hypothetical protein [Armatimonadota bacterium]
MGRGANQGVSPDQLLSALGIGNQFPQLAQQFGLSEQEAADGMSQLLPELGDRLTPNGQFENNDSLQAGLEDLQRLLGDSGARPIRRRKSGCRSWSPSWSASATRARSESPMDPESKRGRRHRCRRRPRSAARPPPRAAPARSHTRSYNSANLKRPAGAATRRRPPTC